MKINEKNLCAFAVSPTVAADKEGYLMKKGEVNKGFQKRWFVLKGNLLFYFEKRSDKEPLGVIILEGCTVELDENDAQFSFKIVFHGVGNRSYVLCAESQESMEQWMKSLACASYDYMKLMVTELQRQLKETRCGKGGKPFENADLNLRASEDTNAIPSFISFVDDGSVTLNCDSKTSPTPTSSPHPPPRNRQNQHHKLPGQSQLAVSQVNVPSMSKTKLGGSSTPILQHSSSSPNNAYYPNQRNKVSFKDMHTAFGRPVLRDRNMWRYKKKSDKNLETVRINSAEPRQFREQNLLISL